MLGGGVGASLATVLEEENDSVEASGVIRCSEGEGSVESKSNSNVESNSNAGARDDSVESKSLNKKDPSNSCCLIALYRAYLYGGHPS